MRPIAIDAIDVVATRMLALTRVVLAFAAFLAVWVDPPPYSALFGVVYGVIALQCIYSLTVMALAARHRWRVPSRALHWIDLAFYISVLCLTGGTSSIFFPLVLFAVLTGSFSHGFQEGIRLTAVSLAAFGLIGAVISFEGVIPEVDRLLMRLAYLTVLGYLFAYWGGQEKRLKKQLALLHDINKGWDPRMGSDQLIGTNLNRLRDAFRAASCVLVLRRTGADGPVIYSAMAESPWRSAIPVEMPPSIAEALLQEDEKRPVGYDAAPPVWRSLSQEPHAFDLRGGMRQAENAEHLGRIANTLETDGFLSAPYAQRDGVTGRLYVTGCARLSRADLQFLAQASAAIATIVENISLTEALVARASEHEREKISRDLHDTTIQPYIALKIAIEAAQRQADPADPLATRLAEIVDMTALTIQDLRAYSANLKGRSTSRAAALEAGIRGQAERLRKFYGIEVDLQVNVPEGVPEHMAAGVFQIASEGLSNILRHTDSRNAGLRVCPDGDDLLIEITNRRELGAEPPEFRPRSIDERAQLFGGRAHVDHSTESLTRVIVRLPFVYSTT